MSAPFDFHQLAADIKMWGRELGFQQVGITDMDLSTEEPRLNAWLAQGYHGTMEWLERRGTRSEERRVGKEWRGGRWWLQNKEDAESQDSTQRAQCEALRVDIE